MPIDGLANVYLVLGEPNQALDLAKSAIQVDPFAPVPYALEARAYLGSGRYADLEKLCSDPVRWKTDMVLFHSTCYLLDFARGDTAAEERELAWASSNPQESLMLEYVALGEMYQGRLGAARSSFDRARQSATRNGLIDFVAELDLDEAGLEADSGLPAEARKHALAALQVAPNTPLLQAFAALALARSGDVADAGRVAEDAARQAPLDTIQNAALLSSVRAAIQLHAHDATGAVKSLDDARPFDNISFMALSPAYYRGLALLEEQRRDEADGVFQQVLDHATLYPLSFYGELAHLKLGRSLQLSDKANLAEEQYRLLDTNWSDADPEFPPLRDLRSYEKDLYRRKK